MVNLDGLGLREDVNDKILERLIRNKLEKKKYHIKWMLI